MHNALSLREGNLHSLSGQPPYRKAAPKSKLQPVSVREGHQGKETFSPNACCPTPRGKIKTLNEMIMKYSEHNILPY